MGTRSLTVIQDSGEPICVLYRQFDGYPEGHGKELAEFLSGFRIVNGYNPYYTAKIANGMNCLAAQIIAHFKKGVGDFYLYPPKTNDVGEEYVYTVDVGQDMTLKLLISEVPYPPEAHSKALMVGTPEDCLSWIKTLEKEETEEEE